MASTRLLVCTGIVQLRTLSPTQGHGASGYGACTLRLQPIGHHASLSATRTRDNMLIVLTVFCLTINLSEAILLTTLLLALFGARRNHGITHEEHGE